MSRPRPKTDRKADGPPPPSERWVWAFFVLGFTVYALGSLFLYVNYRQQAFDLGIYEQSLWLLSHAKTFNTVAGIHVFGAHLSPILVLIAPLAWIPGGAIPELLFQAAVVASGVFPAHWLATRVGRDPRPFVLIYALHPAIVTGTWYGFRPWNLAAPFLMWVSFLVWRRPTSAALIGAGLAGLLLREDIAVWVVLLGILLAVARRIPLPSLILASVILGAATVVAVTVVLPSWSPIDSYLYADTVEVIAPNTDLPTGLASVASRVAFLLLPLGLGLRELRKLWPALILLLPILGLVMRGGNALIPGFHYDMLFVPALVLIVAVWAQTEPRIRFIVVGILAASVAFSPLRPFDIQTASNPLTVSAGVVDDLEAIRAEVWARSTQSTSLSLPNELVPHMAERDRIFIFPYPFDRPSPEPYPMDCPDPEIVVSDAAWLHLSPAWMTASERYRPVLTKGRFTIHVLENPSDVDGPCGPGR